MGFYSLWFPSQYEKHFSINLHLLELTMVMSVPQKSLSMEPTMPTMLRWACWSACSFVTWFFSCSSCTGSTSIVQQQKHEIRNKIRFKLKYAVVLAFSGQKLTDFYLLTLTAMSNKGCSLRGCVSKVRKIELFRTHGNATWHSRLWVKRQIGKSRAWIENENR